MLDFADAFKIAPTPQRKRFPALAEAPPICLLRLAEPNCKKQHVTGPSGSKMSVPGKAWSNAKEQEQQRSTKGGLWHHLPAESMWSGHEHIYTYFSGGDPREAVEKERSCHPGQLKSIKAQDTRITLSAVVICPGETNRYAMSPRRDK